MEQEAVGVWWGGRDAVVEVEAGARKNEWGRGHLPANASSERAALSNRRRGACLGCGRWGGRVFEVVGVRDTGIKWWRRC
jgi:hypothetical protein